MDRWGRKPVMLASGPIILLSWIIAISTKSVPALYVVRLIQGAALAIPYTVTPMYIAEIAEPKLRGQLGGYFQVFFYVGSLYSYALGPYLQYQNYLYLSCLPPVLFLVCYSLMPESPYYLLMAKQEEIALKSLSWLRAETDIQKEFAEIKEHVEEDMRNRGCWRDLVATKKDRRALLIVQIVCIVKYMNGMTSIVLYVTQILTEGSNSVLTSDQMTIVLAVVLIVTTMFSSFIADSVGRRPLLLISTLGATFFHSIVAILYYLDSNTNIDVSSFMWISYACMIGFCVINNVGLGPLMMTIQAEYFPSHTRAKGGGIAGVVTSAACFISIRSYQVVADNFGMYMNYVIFAAISLAGAVIFWAVMQETAGKSLGQIQKSLRAATKSDTTKNVAV